MLNTRDSNDEQKRQKKIKKIFDLRQLVRQARVEHVVVSGASPLICDNFGKLASLRSIKRSKQMRALVTVCPFVMPRAADGGRQPQLAGGSLLVQDVSSVSTQAEVDDAVGRHNVKSVDGEVLQAATCVTNSEDESKRWIQTWTVACDIQFDRMDAR